MSELRKVLGRTAHSACTVYSRSPATSGLRRRRPRGWVERPPRRAWRARWTCRARLAAKQDVALPQADGHGLAALVRADRDRLPQGARGAGPRRRGVGERVARADVRDGAGAVV